MTAPAVAGAAVALAGVRVVYGGASVLDVPALAVRPGEILAVIGPNGSGKSTLLRVLGLLERPSAGEVRLGGRLVRADAGLAERRRMAMVFQRPLLADMTVADNVAVGLRFRGLAGPEVAARVMRWLTRFGIAGLAHRHPRALSGGEAQRVALARALVLAPEVLLLDEPFAALDAPTRAALIDALGRILRAERVTTVLVTHDRDEARALADRVAVLMAGRLRQLDTTARVFQAPVSEEVARFVGVETIVAGEVVARAGAVALVASGQVMLAVAAAAPPGARVRVGIRPEDITLALPAEAGRPSSARNQLTGTIARIAPAGGHLRVTVDVGFPLVAAVTARSAEELGLSEGLAVLAAFKASAAHLIDVSASLDTPSGRAV